MNTPKLLLERRDGVLTLKLHRPDKLNAIDNEMARALQAALDAAAADDSIRAVLLRGAGRAFCAGRDVGAAPTEEDLVLVQGVATTLVQLPKPVLLAVHGWTVGAGLEWMLDADVVVAAESARFKLPEASLGVFVTGGLSATLPAAAGLQRAKALTLLGDTFGAHDAKAWGLVWDVVPDAELEAAAWRRVAQLAALKPEVASRFKRIFNGIGLAAFERGVALENEAERALMQTRGAAG